jgi:hypothetical protein
VSKFYKGNGLAGEVLPYLFCSDSWAIKGRRTDACRQAGTAAKIYVTQKVDGKEKNLAIEDVELYEEHLWIRDEKTGALVSNGDVPYWSDYLLEYFFATDPGEGKTYCQGLGTLGGTQTGTNPRTTTLCPDSFTTTDYSDTLGAVVPKMGMSIQDVLPKSATLYHESFHLVMNTVNTPDFACKCSTNPAIPFDHARYCGLRLTGYAVRKQISGQRQPKPCCRQTKRTILGLPTLIPSAGIQRAMSGSALDIGTSSK